MLHAVLSIACYDRIKDKERQEIIMWTISALKERARERKKTNRWKMILVALILTIAAGTNVSLNYGHTASRQSPYQPA